VHGISTLILVRHYHYTYVATIEQIIIMYRYTGGIRKHPPSPRPVLQAAGVLHEDETYIFGFLRMITTH